MKKRFLFLLLLATAYGPLFSYSQDNGIRQVKISRFELQSSELVKETGESISSPDYHSPVYWFPVSVPSTVLTGLVANRVYPDPYSGLNNMLIPDASDEFNKTYNLEQFSHIPNVGNPWKKPYWYRASFTVPAKDKGRHFQLIFKGINYRAAVWLNGKQIADSTKMVGTFAEYSFDISKIVKAGEENALAVKIYPLDYPGLPATEQLKALGDFYANGGPTGDIGKNVTMVCSAGWDWMPPVRDRNMGIWQPVYIRTSGKVTLSNPQLITDLPNLPDTSVAKLSLKLTLSNHDQQSSKGILKVNISPENFKGSSLLITKELNMAANNTSEVNFTADQFKQLIIKQPRLWWPSGYGNPNLYRVQLKYESNGVISDDTTFVFGIRTVSSKAVEVPGKNLRRDFYVNGKRVHLTGGAWVPDMMLNRDSIREDEEMHLYKNSNINLVRIWGGGITPPDVFFDLADKYGMLVWSDFWVTGDTHGEFKGSTDNPVEGKVFLNNVTSTIYRIRNHPSLLVWTGGNEGHVRKELYDAMRDYVISLDGTRPFIPCSSGFAKLPEGSKSSWPDNLAPGVYSGGPYGWRDSKEYYRLADEAKDWVFKDETGLPSQPTYNGLKKIIPNLVWDKTLPFPLNHTWGYHDAATSNGKYDKYYNSMVARYGEPVSMEDFSNKMQLMNATGYQAIFEAAGHKLNDIGGVMLWKLNAAFPSVVWQIFDWYLEPNAGYYFMQNACEKLHIQLNPRDSMLTVVNRTYRPYSNLTAEAEIYDINSGKAGSQSVKLNISSTEVKEAASLSKMLGNAKGVSLILVKLKDASGKVISGNTYWFAPNDDFKALNTMPKAGVKTTLLKKEEGKTEKKWTLRLTNTSDKVAFFIHPQLLENEEEVLPSYWSAGYFSLAPMESTEVTVSAPKAKIKDRNQEIRIEGWNLTKTTLKL